MTEVGPINPVTFNMNNYTTAAVNDGTSYNKYTKKITEYPNGSTVERVEKTSFTIYDKVNGRIVAKEIPYDWFNFYEFSNHYYLFYDNDVSLYRKFIFNISIGWFYIMRGINEI